MLGPATYENERLPWMSEFPSMNCSRGVTETKTVGYERSKKTAKHPATKATA